MINFNPINIIKITLISLKKYEGLETFIKDKP